MLESNLVSRVTALVVTSAVTSSALVTIATSTLGSKLLRWSILVGVIPVSVAIVLVIQLAGPLLGLVVGTHLVVLVHACGIRVRSVIWCKMTPAYRESRRACRFHRQRSLQGAPWRTGGRLAGLPYAGGLRRASCPRRKRHQR